MRVSNPPTPDDLDRALTDSIKKLQVVGHRAGRLRAIVECLHASGRGRQDFYRCLVRAKVDRPQASRLARLAACEDAYRKFTIEKLPWQECLLAARQPPGGKNGGSPGGPPGEAISQPQLNAQEKALYRLAALLISTGRTELAHARGLFRLEEPDAPATGQSQQTSP
jgi:hypothetical protein